VARVGREAIMLTRTAVRARGAPAKTKTKAIDTARKPSLAEGVYQSIKRDIFDFRLLPGDRFTEGQVAASLNVSRTPVREGLQRLEKEGYLHVHFRAGWSVRDLDFQKFDDLYDLRIILESAAVRQLCDRAERPQLDHLRSIWLVPVEERSTDREEMAQLDESFHTSLVDAAGNPEVLRCHRDVTERIRILRRLDFTETDRITATYQEHGQILRAILRRRADQATLLLRAHIETSKTEVRKISLHQLYAARKR
jgi:DNA-binding GntR family transcriptional regulator